MATPLSFGGFGWGGRYSVAGARPTQLQCLPLLAAYAADRPSFVLTLCMLLGPRERAYGQGFPRPNLLSAPTRSLVGHFLYFAPGKVGTGEEYRPRLYYAPTRRLNVCTRRGEAGRGDAAHVRRGRELCGGRRYQPRGTTPRGQYKRCPVQKSPVQSAKYKVPSTKCLVPSALLASTLMITRLLAQERQYRNHMCSRKCAFWQKKTVQEEKPHVQDTLYPEHGLTPLFCVRAKSCPVLTCMVCCGRGTVSSGRWTSVHSAGPKCTPVLARY
eukprot:1968860-Rhodomonas_salina.3